VDAAIGAARTTPGTEEAVRTDPDGRRAAGEVLAIMDQRRTAAEGGVALTAARHAGNGQSPNVCTSTISNRHSTLDSHFETQNVDC
jgi:hypothetical protein